VPAGSEEVRAWFALPDDRDELQSIRGLKIDVEAPPGTRVERRETRDARGNRFLFVEARGAAGGTLRVSTTFDLERREALHRLDPAATRPPTESERQRMARYLEDDTNVVATPAISEAARSAVGTEENPVRVARSLYDWTLEHVQYWVKFPDRMKASGVGSSVYCFEQCTGNCTDFHSLFAAAARSTGLPTRMVYGSFLKAPLDGEEKDQSYHCWIEFWAPELGWIPLDVAVADLFVDDFELDDENRGLVDLTVAAGYRGPDPERVEYYFGNLDARRVTWHRGRDLELDPPPAAGRINALPKAHVEVDGVPQTGWTRMLTFVEHR